MHVHEGWGSGAMVRDFRTNHTATRTQTLPYGPEWVK